ncbi:MAG: tRNA lysidine(34) synthetase TilS [Chloroflexi bacterium]|nr:tRNA lysidine(34) synthetase TilS [Chloroflexota bacterium]
MAETPALVDRVATAIDRRHLLPTGPVVIGFSGGPDSLCLLHLLADLAPRRGWRLVAAHLDHGLRPESAAEVATVRALAAARGVPLHSARQPVGDTAGGTGVEAAARRARYHFLAGVAAAHGDAPVAVGHTEDDQAETLLLHLARGAGVSGLAAMRPATLLPAAIWGEPDGRPLRVVRPLLATSRSEVEAEVARRGLTPLRDPSNADPRFARNRLRHGLLPAWQALDPGIGARLARAADLLAADEAVLAALTDVRWPHLAMLVDEAGPPGVALARAAFLAEPLALQRRLLRRAVAALGRPLPTLAAIDAALAVAAGPAGGQADLVGGVRLTVETDRLWLGGVPAPPRGPWMTPGASLPLALDGATPLPGADWTITCHRLAAGVCRFPLDGSHAHFAPALAIAAAHLRTRRPGDRVALPGGAGHQKLSDLHIDRKTPRAERAGVPLLVASDTIVWVVGHRTTAAFSPADGAPVLCCQVGRVMRDA